MEPSMIPANFRLAVRDCQALPDGGYQLTLIVKPTQEAEAPAKQQQETEEAGDLLPFLQDSNLSARCQKCLALAISKRIGTERKPGERAIVEPWQDRRDRLLKTAKMSDLFGFRERDLLRIKHFGQKCLDELRTALQAKGLTLAI
jgi:DNA-directed RNA polymerase alpha subunit